MNILAIIPARGGSKGIKNKNIVKFCGKPLIYWTIKAAQNTKLIDNVIVSTDSKKIKEIVEKYNVDQISLRPKKYSTDNATTLSVLKYEVKKLEKHNYFPDIIVTLQPTSPLRNSKHIDTALKIFLKDKNADSLVSCVEVPHNFNPESLMELNKKYLKDTKFSKKKFRRQEKKKYYARNGASIYITKRSKIDKYVYGGNTLAYEMDFIHSIDIDTENDIKIAEIFQRNLRKK